MNKLYKNMMKNKLSPLFSLLYSRVCNKTQPFQFYDHQKRTGIGKLVPEPRPLPLIFHIEPLSC